MAKPPRDRTVDGWNVYFVTPSTWGHRSLFQTERMARLFVDTILHYRKEGKFSLHEFVVMPDHFHLLLSPASGVALERAVQFIKGGFPTACERSWVLASKLGSAATWIIESGTSAITCVTLSTSGGTRSALTWWLPQKSICTPQQVGMRA